MLRKVLTMLVFGLAFIQLNAQCDSESFACNGSVNVSVDSECSLGAFDASLFLEGETDLEDYDYVILNSLDEPIDLSDLSAYVGQCLTYNVFSTCSGNMCWGEVCLEDKEAPVLNCECETPYLDDGVTPNPDCTFKCYDVWDLELLESLQRSGNELLPSVFNFLPEDNCLDFGVPTVTYAYTDGVNCGDQIVVRNLAWTYVDFAGQIQHLSCTQNYLFESIDITSVGTTGSGTWDGYASIFDANVGDAPLFDFYTPEPIVNLECGAGTDPADIATFYDIDTPGRPSPASNNDYDSETPNIVEFNEGFPYAYPYVVVQGWTGRFHAKPIDNNICNLYSVYSDLSYDACADGCYGNSKIARTWTLLDWCTATTLDFVQTIKRIDNEGPAVSSPDVTISVDPWACTADYVVPAPEHLLDNCDQDATWSVTAPAGTSVVNGTLVGLPKGNNQFAYEAVDCCGNVSVFNVNVFVEDRVAPNAISTQNLVVQLSNDQDGDGIAKLFAVDVDNASHDDCTDIKLEIRRPDDIDWCHSGNSTFNNDGHPGDDPNDTDNGEYVIFCCEDLLDIDENGTAYGLHDVLLRVWDDGDMNGVFGTAGDNYNEVWTTVRVEDKQAPIVVCPPHIELSCHEDFNDYALTGTPYGFTTCGTIECDEEPSDSFRAKPINSAPFVGEAIPAYNPSCRRGAIQRRWSCDGVQCTQWIIMRDTEEGDLDITWPDDITVDCIDTDAGEPVVVDRLCELTGTSLQSDTFNFEDGACFTILNHWTVINWCDYVADDSDLNDVDDLEDDGFVPGYYTHTQIIKLTDTEAPILSVADTCFAVNADCVGEGIELWAAAADNGMCASDWLKWKVEVDMHSDWDIDYTFSSFLPSNDAFYLPPTGGEAAMPVMFDETVIINSTIQSDALTNGEEISVEDFFGVPANSFAQAAIIRDKVEWIGYLNGLYDIDLDPECLSFTVVAGEDDPTYGDTYGVLGEGEIYRYYLNFPNGHNIIGGLSSDGSTNLVVVSDTRVIVEVGEGFNFVPGASFKFDLQSVGESIHIPLPDGLPNGCASNHRVRWTVLDGCGNETSGTSFFTIEDKKKPTPYMLNLSTALMSDGTVELWAKDFDAGSFDNCSPQDFLLYTFSDNVPPQLIDPSIENPYYDADGVASENDYNNGNAEAWDGVAGTSAMIFNQDDLITQAEKGGTLPVPIYVWDLCGNFDLAIVQIKLVDNGGDASNIAGRVATETGTGVEGVMVSAVSQGLDYTASSETVENGEYMIEYNPLNNDYTVSGEKNDDWLNGVTTLDILLIQRHILSISELDSPYKLIAADANNDERISAVDLIQLRKLILGIFEELPNNDSWRFTDADASMNSTSPWPFSEFIDIVDFDQDMLDEDFIAMKIGDVNGSVELNFAGEAGTETRSANKLEFDINTVDLGHGEVAIEFTSANFNQIAGLQFTLEGNQIEAITGIESGLLSMNDTNVAIANNALAISWNDSKAVTYNDGVLFTITAKVSTGNTFAITDKVINAEAYQGETLEIIGVTTAENVEALNSLAQNEPNPWKATTNIEFNLENDATTTFKVFSATGELVFKNTANYKAGSNVIALRAEDLNGATGVLYYTVESGNFTSTRKMIVLN